MNRVRLKIFTRLSICRKLRKGSLFEKVASNRYTQINSKEVLCLVKLERCTTMFGNCAASAFKKPLLAGPLLIDYLCRLFINNEIIRCLGFVQGTGGSYPPIGF